MTIERVVDVFGAVVKRRIVPPGWKEDLSGLGTNKVTPIEKRGKYGMEITGQRPSEEAIRNTTPLRVCVETEDSLAYQTGHYNYDRSLIGAGVSPNLKIEGDVRTVEKLDINTAGIETPRKFGVRTSFRWKPSLKIDPYKASALEDLVNNEQLTREQADAILYDLSKKQKRLK